MGLHKAITLGHIHKSHPDHHVVIFHQESAKLYRLERLQVSEMSILDDFGVGWVEVAHWPV